MYPHALDRYRLIEWIVRDKRSTQGIRQTDIKTQGQVAQYTVSNFENLTSSLSYPNRRVSRDEAIKIMASGLKLPQEDIDALLWLFDGNPLTEQELSKYHIPDAQSRSYKPGELRKVIICLLEEVLDHHIREGRYKADMALLFADRSSSIQETSMFLRMLGLAGERLLVGGTPLSINPIVSWHREHLELQFGEYGFRAVYSVNDLFEALRYFDPQMREQQIGSMIVSLRNNPHYSIALVEDSFPVEFELVGQEVLVRAKPGNGAILEYMHFVDEATALNFVLAFEKKWDEIPTELRTKDMVISRLEQMLKESEALK